MAKKLTTLSPPTVALLHRDHISLRNRINAIESQLRGLGGGAQAPLQHVAKVDEGGIEPLDNDKPGFGDVTVQKVDGNGEFVATVQKKIVYSLAPLKIEEDVFIQIWRDPLGKWWAEYPRDISSQATADGLITAGGSGLVSLHLDGVDTGVKVTAHLTWAEGGVDVEAGDEIYIWYDSNSKKWFITGGQCPT